MIVYIKTQGAKIIKEGRHLLVKKGDATCNTLFTYKLSQIVIFGNVEITHRAMAQLMRYEIDTVFLTQNGRYLGRIASPEFRNVFLHKRQYDLLGDNDFGVRMALAIVAGKLSNMATVLMRLKRTRSDEFCGQRAREIQSLMAPLLNAANIDSIRGYEGRGSAIYFSAFPRGFIENMGFTRRIRRPPTDPVNSILSLLYTFLMNRVYAACRVAALDPYPGALHTPDYGRYSLVLDLMEEFRTIIVDTLTLSLFNLKILKEEDFYREITNEGEEFQQMEDNPVADVTRDPIGRISGGSDNFECFDLPEQRIDEHVVPASAPAPYRYPVKLHPHAFERVIEAFEKKLTTSFFYPPAERSLTYADALIFQAVHYRKVLEGEAAVYQPVLLK
ncbi:MAG: CRISPR-associated endonuclease Cas1 [Syntrophobacterales bacterium]|nr:CRISPR-associated endonuclease Cas1 [Syntrophobacterales bacterium]